MTRDKTMEKRREDRISKNFLVYLKEDNIELLGVTSNISKNGLFVESFKVFPSNREIYIVLAVDKDLYDIRGEVIWSTKVSDDSAEDIPSGMGLKIIEAPAEYWNYMEYMKYDESVMV